MMHAIVGWHSIADRWLPVIVAAMLTALFLWSRSTPIRIDDSSISSSVTPGGSVIVMRHVEWHRAFCNNAAVEATIIDSMMFKHELDAMSLIDDGQDMDTSRVWTVPYGMPWGPARYQSRLTFSCFPFYGAWPIVVSLPELDFEITPAP